MLGNPVVFAQVDVKNLLPRANRARVTAAFTHDDGELTPRARTCCIRTFRFPRPRLPTPRDGLYFQPGEALQPRRALRVRRARGAAARQARRAVLPAGRNRAPAPVPDHRGAARATPDKQWGRSFYELRLPRFGRRSLLFRMPVIPIALGAREYGAISRTSFGGARGQVRGYFNRLFAASTFIRVPERKVVDTYYASLANMALPRYRLPNGAWVQTVNNMRYHSF